MRMLSMRAASAIERWKDRLCGNGVENVDSSGGNSHHFPPATSSPPLRVCRASSRVSARSFS